MIDGCYIYFHSHLGSWQHPTPWLFPLALHTFCKAIAQVIVPLLASHLTVGPNTSAMEDHPSWRMTRCITTSESAFQFIKWESSISLSWKFFVGLGFFKHHSILDLTLHSPISVSNNHSNSEGKHSFKGLYSPTSSLAAFKIRCYFDFPPGNHLRIFFASNHNYSISPCISSPPWAGG